MKYRRLAVVPVGLGAVYLFDRHYCFSVGTRSARTLAACSYLIYQYKLIWTPDNACEVHSRVARKIADTCLANEGLYVKFGQILSSMAFALPIEYDAPLSELHDQAKTFEIEQVLRIIDSQIPDVELKDFETLPVASASLAQVHKAVHAPTGKMVAVKIQKPNVAVQAWWDLQVYWLIINALEWAFDLPIKWTFDFTKSQLLGELDFRAEAYHSEKAKTEFAESKLNDKIYVPEVLASSQRVLVTEWIADAVKITDKEGMRKLGIDPVSAVNDAISAFAFQVFHTGHVHCDPHPGNLLVRRNTQNGHQIVLIDHGLYVDLDAELRQDYAKLWISMIPPIDRETMRNVCSKWGIRDFDLYASITAFKPSINRMIHDKQSTQRETNEYQSKAKDRLINALSDTSKFPRPLLFVGRSQNYIRAANWAHGNPVDRVAVMIQYARESLPKDNSLKDTYLTYLPFFLRWVISPFIRN